MGLVERLEKVDTELFGVIGLLKCEPVRVQLDRNAEPRGVNTATTTPFPSLPHVEERLRRMEKRVLLKESQDKQRGAYRWYRYRKVMVSSGFALI